MFTGIIEDTALVENVEWDKTNLILTLSCSLTSEFYLGQSIAHNGVCLTVTDLNLPFYKVTLINETINKTNFKYVQKGDLVNIERSLKLNERLDGHIVTGHIDTTGVCEEIIDRHGSKEILIKHTQNEFFTTIPKGSIAINGISLTVVKSAPDYFTVHVIPYTLEHTNLKNLRKCDVVNLEFDILAKYIYRYTKQIKS